MAPTAAPETASTTTTTPVTINLTIGASGNPTSAALVGTPVGGTVTGFPGTTVTFTPTTKFTGTSSFQFTLANASGTSNTATATITVTKGVPPVAVNEAVSTSAGTAVTFDLGKGASGNPTKAAAPKKTPHGMISAGSGTMVTYTPTSGFVGTDSFQFTLSNSYGKSNAATATINVTGLNLKLSASPYCNTSPPTAPAVKLSWTAQTDATSYDLYRNGALYSEGITQTSFDNNANVAGGSTYGYFVVAHGTAGDSESNPVSVAVPNHICPQALLPDLVVQNFQLSSAQIAAGSNAVVRFTIHNKGGGSAAPSLTHIRLGKFPTSVTVNDPLLLDLGTPALALQDDPAKTKGDSFDVNEAVTVPNNQAAGTYYLWVILDSTSSAGQGKTNENNDKVLVATVSVTNPQGPDLAIRNFTIDPQKIAPGASVTVKFSIANQGSKAANSSMVKIFLSTSNSDIGPADPLLGSPITVPSLVAGQVLPRKVTVTIPAQQVVGDYYLWVMLDAGNIAGEPPAAKANDKAYTAVEVATDAAPVPLNFANALVDAVKTWCSAPRLEPATVADNIDAIYKVQDSFIKAGKVFDLLNNRDPLLASFEFVKNSDPSLADAMTTLEQRFVAHKLTPLAFSTGVTGVTFVADLIIDYCIGERARDRGGLALLHSQSHTAIYFGAALVVGSVVGPEVAAAALPGYVFGQGILIWKDLIGLRGDTSGYVNSLVSLGSQQLAVYDDINQLDEGTSAGRTHADKLKALIASTNGSSWDNVYALSREPLIAKIYSIRPLVAWRIIQGLVQVRKDEKLNNDMPNDLSISDVSKVISEVNSPPWQVIFVLPGMGPKAFANYVASQYRVKSWVPLL